MGEEGEEIYNYYGGEMENIYAKIKGNSANNTKPKVHKTQEEIDTQKNIFLARNNSVKNSMLKSSSPNIFVGKNSGVKEGQKKKKGLLGEKNNNNNQNNISLLNKNNNNKNQRNKKVNFSFSTNIVNKYEQQKPITLTSKKKNVMPGNKS